MDRKTLQNDLEYFSRKNFLTDYSIYQSFLELAVKVTQSEIGYLHFYNETSEEIALNVWSENVLAHCRTSHDSHYPLKEAGIWADSIRDKKTTVHNDYGGYQQSKLPDGHIPLTKHMSSPIFEKGKIIGIIGVGNKRTNYTKIDIKALEDLISIGWNFVNSHLYQLTKRNQEITEKFSTETVETVLINMVSAIGKALELRDEYTASHQQNVSTVCVALGKKLGLNERDILGLEIGSLIHDIGKITIPAEILNKPGKLFPVERELLKIHASNGAEIFKGVQFPWPIYEMILQHHERIDGSGYPNGIIGEEICLEAKIIAVADSLDAMAADRPYRKSLGLQKAIDTIRVERGVTLDSYVVDALLEIYEKEELLYTLYGTILGSPKKFE